VQVKEQAMHTLNKRRKPGSMKNAARRKIRRLAAKAKLRAARVKRHNKWLAAKRADPIGFAKTQRKRMLEKIESPPSRRDRLRFYSHRTTVKVFTVSK
jgi:hypothetical protein